MAANETDGTKREETSGTEKGGSTQASGDNASTVDQLVAKATEMKDGVANAQNEIAAIEKTGDAAGGLVQAVCDGTGRLRSIKIDPSLMDGEAAVLEELIVNAVGTARESVQEEAGRKVNEMLGGLPIPSSLTRLIAQFMPVGGR